jgi:hypothetical protein
MMEQIVWNVLKTQPEDWFSPISPILQEEDMTASSVKQMKELLPLKIFLKPHIIYQEEFVALFSLLIKPTNVWPLPKPTVNNPP